LNENSIEFFLSTQTRSSSKTSQSKFLQILSISTNIITENLLEILAFLVALTEVVSDECIAMENVRAMSDSRLEVIPES